jgi:hypothetical protein
MPEEKKPWEQNLSVEDSSEKKPWEQNFSVDAEDTKKKSDGVSSLPLVSSAGVSTSESESQRFNFATGQNDLPPVDQAPVTPLPIQQNEADLLRAAGTTQETVPVDQSKFNPKIQEKGLDLDVDVRNLAAGIPKGYGGPLDKITGEKTEALVSGLAKAGSYLLQSPAAIYDLAATATNRVINQPLGLPDAPMMSQMEGESIYKGAVSDLEKAIKNQEEIEAMHYDKGITQYLFGDEKERDLKKGLSLLGNSVIKSLPTSISLMAGMMVNPLAANAVGAAAFAADKKRSLDEMAPDMPEDQKVMWASLSGGTEMALENFGITKLGPMLAATLKKSGKEAMEAEAKEVFKETVGKITKRYFGIHAQEVGSEMLNTFVQNVYDVASGANPDKKLMDGVMDSGLIAFASSAGMTGPAYLADVAVTKKVQKKGAELQAQKEALTADLQSPDVAENVKQAISEKIKDINEEEANLIEQENEKIDNLTPEQKQQVQELMQQSNEATDRALDPAISEGTREIFKKDLEAIDREVDKVFEMGVAQGETKAEPVELSPEIEEQAVLEDPVNQDWMKAFEESIKPVEVPVSEKSDLEVPVVEAPAEEVKQEKEKPVQELVDEQEQIEARKTDDDQAVKKLNDDIEVLKKFDKEDIASKKFKAIIDRAFKMKEEGKISKPTYTKYRNIAQQVLGPKISVDAEQAKFKIETLKEEVKKKLLGEGYKKVLMSAPGFGPKQVADLIDLTAMAAKKAIDAGFAVKEAVEKALTHIKNHPHYAKLIEEGKLDEKTFAQSVSDTFVEPEKKTAPAAKKETIDKKPEGEVSGIKKALVSDEIIRGVDLEKISDKEMQGLAKKIIDSGEIKPEAIINEVLKKHRALQPKEVVALIYYKTQLDNELRETYEEKSDLIESGESTGSVDARIVDLEHRRENFDEVSVITASQQSLAFRLRKGMRDRDFNLVDQIAQYKATNNGEIPAEVEAKMRDLDKRYREALAKVDELEKKVEESEIDRAHKNIIEDIAREQGIEKGKTYTQKSKELADKVRKLKSKPLKFTTADGKEVDIKLQGISMDGLIELAARTIETTGKVIDGVNAVVKEVKNQEWYKKLTEKDQQAIQQQIHDYFGEDEKPIAQPHINEDGSLAIPHSLIREIYKSGITDINGIVKAVQEKIDIPDVTDRQVRDAITRYGKIVNLSKDEVEAGIRQAKRIGKLISQLDDIQKKERPKRSGLQRDKPSDEERRLTKEVKREMSNLPEDPEENARALKSALDATKSRLRNRIADLENQLETGEKTKKGKGVELDAEAKELKERVEKLRADLIAVEGKPKITDAQRIARMKTYTANRIKELEAKIKNKDFTKPEKPKPISDPELTKARGDLLELRDEWEKLQYENELRNRTKFEKAKAWALGILTVPRALKLGFDLSAIGVQGLRRLSTSPVQSGKAFKDMLDQVFSEKAQKDWMKNLKAQDFYPTLKAMGATFTETDGKLSVREENFSNDLVKHVFGFVFNKKLGLDKANLYEVSNRAFSGYLNSIRLQGYLEGMAMLERKGKTFESHPQDYKSWAKYINNITGRGSLGKKGNSSELAQFIFTSPRKMISELNLINPWFWSNIMAKDEGRDYDYRLTPTVARKAFGDFALGLGITAAVTALARAAFSDDQDKDDKDFTDPRSSNFMGVKIRDDHGGFTVVHPFASYKTEAVLLSRLLSGKMANTRTGRISKLGKEPNTKGTDLIVSFLSNKLSPTVQIPWKYWKQGGKYNVKAEALKTIQPAAVEGFLQTYEDYPAEVEAVLTALAFLGISETHIEKKK